MQTWSTYSREQEGSQTSVDEMHDAVTPERGNQAKQHQDDQEDKEQAIVDGKVDLRLERENGQRQTDDRGDQYSRENDLVVVHWWDHPDHERLGEGKHHQCHVVVWSLSSKVLATSQHDDGDQGGTAK